MACKFCHVSWRQTAPLKMPILFYSDLDFEYPTSSAEGVGFAALVTEVQAAFSQLQRMKGDATPYQVTVQSFCLL